MNENNIPGFEALKKYIQMSVFYKSFYSLCHQVCGCLSRQFPFKERSQQENNDQINKTLPLTHFSAES